MSVYVLTDPRSMKVCYVGLSNNVKARLTSHRGGWTNKPISKCSLELRAIGQELQASIVEEIFGKTRTECEVREAYWITHFRALNPDIFNRKPSRKRAQISQ